MTRTPDPIDVHVGNRLRLARRACGFSQKEVAQALSVSAQQLQKYEEGSTRLTPGRLFRLAGYFDVSVGFFFEDMPIELRRSLYGTPGSENQEPVRLAGLSLSGVSRNREVLRLVGAFLGIPDLKLRAELVTFVTALRRSFMPRRRPGPER